MSRLADMALEAGRQIGRTDTDAQTYLKQAINRRYREILARTQWSEMHRQISVTVTAGSSTVGIPQQVAIVHSAYNVTNSIRMERMSPNDMEFFSGDTLATASSPTYWANMGSRGSFANFSGSEVPTVVSSNAADSCVCTVTGFDANNLPYTATATVNGTNSISLAPTFSADGATIESFTKDRTTSGIISLQQTTPGVVGKIAPTELSARYSWLRFDCTAASATEIRLQCRMHAPDLTSDDALPLLLDIDHILVCGAVADGLRKYKEYSKAGFEEQRFQNLLDNHVAMRDEEGGGISASGTMHKYRE